MKFFSHVSDLYSKFLYIVKSLTNQYITYFIYVIRYHYFYTILTYDFIAWILNGLIMTRWVSDTLLHAFGIE